MAKKKKVFDIKPADEQILKKKVEKAKKKVEPKEVHVGVSCPKCKKIVEMCICEGRYKTCISTKQISGKASNPDFPCPFCNARLPMPQP